MRKNKIYLGPANTANFFKELEKSLRSVGLHADFIPWSSEQHEFYSKNTKVFRLFNKPLFKIFGKNIFYFINLWILKPYYFIYSLLKYDTFFFIKPISFYKSNKDLTVLRFFKKRIVFFYLGCNDRNPSFSSEPDYVCNICHDKEKQLDNNCHNLEFKKLKARYYAKYATKVFGFRDNLDFIDNAGKQLYVGLNNIFIPYHKKGYKKKLKIVHLPSNPNVKGSLYIEPVLKKIAQEEDVEIILKKDAWSYDKIINILKESHILVDSLAAYSFGKISLEAIQYACVPLSTYPDWISNYYDIPPVVAVNKNNLYDILKMLIADRNILTEYACRSQQAFNKYFTHERAGNYYKNILDLK